MAGRVVALEFAGSALHTRFSRAFEHLDEPSREQPSLTVHLWDSATTGAPEPPLPDVPFDSEAPGTVVVYNAGSSRALFQPNLRALSVFDLESSEAWYWTADAARLPEWECGTPIRHLLNWWLAEHDTQVLHSGAVATPAGGVLLAGRAGSGKSTSSLSTLGAGFSYAGDDFVAVTLDPLWVHSLYNSAKLDPSDGHRFAAFLPSVTTAARERAIFNEKAVVYVHRDCPQQIVSGFPLRALLIPRLSNGSDSGVQPLSRAQALAALAPSTIGQLRGSPPEALALMSKLVAVIPTYRLQVGSELEGIPIAISRLLDELNK